MARHRRRKRPIGPGGSSPGDEPRPDVAELWDWGEEPVVAVDFTSGGAPIGLTLSAYREGMKEMDPRAGWATAKEALRAGVGQLAPAGAKVDVGWVKSLGEGLDRDVFWASVEVRPDPDKITGDYTAAVPRTDAPSDLAERARREAKLLPILGGAGLPFRVPRRAVAVDVNGLVVLVREALAGIPVDPRFGRQGSLRPWEIVGGLAAAVHRIDTSGWPLALPGHPTRRAHARAHLAAVDALPSPIREDALDWAEGHLPDDSPAVLLHGDLLGQNILLGLDEPHALIDWEFAGCGDPAFDLAIVTRAARKPFQVADGFGKLLDAYLEAGGQRLLAAHVRLHELCLLASWYRDALQGVSPHAPEHELDHFCNVLRRTRAGS